jgi:hypothetical protein
LLRRQRSDCPTNFSLSCRDQLAPLDSEARAPYARQNKVRRTFGSQIGNRQINRQSLKVLSNLFGSKCPDAIQTEAKHYAILFSQADVE